MSVLLTPEKGGLKAPNSSKKEKIKLPVISPEVGKSQKNLKYKPISTIKRKKKNINKNESLILLSDAEMKEKYNEICNLYRTPYDLCIKCLENFPSNRNSDIINLIKRYLTDLIGLVDLISRIKNITIFDKVLVTIAERLKYKYLPPNRYVCRFGDKGTHFSILLKGKIIFVVPKIIKCYLNRGEYIQYLLKLKKYGEYELLRKTLNINQQYFDLGEDFDAYLRELLNSVKKRHKNHLTFLTNELYNEIKNILSADNKSSIDINDNDSDNENINKIRPDFNDKITPEIYIERIKIPDLNLNPKDRKKVSIFYYQNSNFYEGGQIYGYVALENKNNKITATAITAGDCYIGTLTKEEYRTHLLAVHTKSRELLYNLISSYDILGFAPKKAFDNRFCHMFKCIRFKKGTNILEKGKKLNSVYIFYSGKFTIELKSNIIELYDLVAKIKEIRGKAIGIKENEIRKELSDIYLKKEFYMNKQYSVGNKNNFYLKKYNLTISLVNDKFCVGLIDTLDPETRLGLFNSTCSSINCDGYEITYDSLKLVNKEYPCLNNCNKISLINLEYYLKRVQLHIKEIELNIKKYEDNLKFSIKSENRKNIRFNTEENIEQLESDKSDSEDNNFEIRRNTFHKPKKTINNEINLVQNIGDSLKLDFNSMMKKKLSNIGRKFAFESNNNILNKKYENIKTLNNELEESEGKKDLSFITRIRRSIRQKNYLLHLAQCKSNRYMKIQKDEIRSILMAKNKRVENNNYADLGAIFKNKKKNTKKKSEEVSDSILDNIISGINKQGKYERILSSYLLNDQGKEIKEINKNMEISKVREDKDINTEDPQKIKNIKKSDLFLVDSRFKNIRKKMEIENDLIQNKNIINLDGCNSLGSKYMHEESTQTSNKKYNKQLNMNKLRKVGILNYSESKKIKDIFRNKGMNKNINLNRSKVHLVDPLFFDKFNERYYDNNKRFKTLEN